MKLILAVFILLTVSVSAHDIEVSQMKSEEGYDARFSLKSNYPQRIVLDCQSFIQGLFFGPLDEEMIMLQDWECLELLEDMKLSMEQSKKHCVEVDFDQSIITYQATCP